MLSGVAPANAPLLIRSARELGFKGLISTETAQDAKVLEEGAGDLANGFISVGGASTPEIRSKAMEEFIDRYTKKFGEYNDELNTKVYALQYIVDTLKADPKAIDNVDEFKKTIDAFSAPNPYLKDSVGEAALCRHDVVRPEAAARGAAGRQRVRGRQVQDSVRRQRRLSQSPSPRLRGEGRGEALRPTVEVRRRPSSVACGATFSPHAGEKGFGTRAWNRSSPTGSTSARNTR